MVGDAAVDVRLGGEVDDDVDALVAQQRGHGVAVGDVDAHEAEPRVGGQVGEVREVAGVGEEVDRDQALDVAARAGRRRRAPGARSSSR